MLESHYPDEALEMTDGWRVWWENTTMPALLGGLLAKRVHSYPNDQSGTSNGSTDFYYAHDAIGNVIAVSDGNGARQHHFTQDAFGNRLTLASLGGDDWNDAHENGIWEHQTGKWFDPETELYFFHARWVDPVVGRFVSATVLPRHEEQRYEFCENNPVGRFDPDGLQSISGDRTFRDWLRDLFGGIVDLFRDDVGESLRPGDPLLPGSPNLSDVACDAADGVGQITCDHIELLGWGSLGSGAAGAKGVGFLIGVVGSTGPMNKAQAAVIRWLNYTLRTKGKLSKEDFEILRDMAAAAGLEVTPPIYDSRPDNRTRWGRHCHITKDGRKINWDRVGHIPVDW